jgi:uncharacterized protein (DUF849 family)
MRKREKVIVSCAITGAIHTPTMTPHLPVTPQQIAESAIGAAQAGAAIVHLHARIPETGKPAQDPDLYGQFVSEINAATDVIINITTGGGLGMSLDDRLAPARRFKPELASLNMGSMNFGIFPAAGALSNPIYDWEIPYLESTRDYVFKNTYTDIEAIVAALGADGTRFEFECYDVGHLYNLAHYLDTGVVKPPLFVQAVFGILGGIGPEPENLVTMKTVADRLFGDDYHLSVLGAGRHQTNLVTMGAIMGGNVRVGLEDSIYLRRGVLAESNAAEVEKIIRILNELSLEAATPDEARAMLELKGAANTAIPEPVG